MSLHFLHCEGVQIVPLTPHIPKAASIEERVSTKKMPLRRLSPDVGPNKTRTTDAGATKVDIIAVHGLNPRSKNDAEHAWDTWRTPSGSSGRLWLRDDLPQHVLDTRIFLYEYNATAVYGKDRDTFIGKANELLEAIRIERDDSDFRPILFLGHSMGGLLIKQALINAHNNPKYAHIKDATSGLAFFATPHNGGDGRLVSLGRLAAKIATTTGFQKGDDVIETLTQGSIFSEIMQEHWKHQLLKYDIISFWGALDHVVPMESARFGLPGDRENIVKLNADHKGVCKFGPSQNDQDNLKLVRRNIKDIYENALKRRADKHRQDSRVPIKSYPPIAMAPVKTFVPRTALLSSIRQQLCRGNVDGQPALVGVWGMGGVGKSQLALSYLQRYGDEYDAMFWIHADQQASIDRDFLGIYQTLPKDPAQQLDPTPENARQIVLGLLANATGKWLLVFDGADGLDRKNNNFVDLFQYVPGNSDCHVVITSRTSVVRKLSTFQGVEVGELEESAAVDLFFQCSELRRTRQNAEEEIKAIVKELGCLALAISIAGTYVSQTPRLSSNLPGYLHDYRQRRHKLLSQQSDEVTERYSNSVMTVWETSYTAVYEQLPEACRLLTLLAFIHYEDIFLELFRLDARPSLTATERETVSWISILKSREPVDVYFLERCFTILERYSLVQRPVNQPSYSMHRLVHAWTYDRLREDATEMKYFWLGAVQLLSDILKDSFSHPNTPEFRLRLAPHLTGVLMSFQNLTEVSKWNEFDEAMVRLESFGAFLHNIGRWMEAAAMFREVLQKRQQILGDKHPSMISAMNNLAITLGDQGKLKEAAVIKKKVLEKR